MTHKNTKEKNANYKSTITNKKERSEMAGSKSTDKKKKIVKTAREKRIDAPRPLQKKKKCPKGKKVCKCKK